MKGPCKFPSIAWRFARAFFMSAELLTESRQICRVGFNPVTVFTGSEVNAVFTGSQKYQYARTVSDSLRQHPYRMRQIAPWDLIGKMNAGDTAVAIDDQQELVGFVQVGKRPNSSGVYECGSWKSYRRGVGRGVMIAGARLAMSQKDAKQAVALVADGNEGAIASMLNLGAKPLDEPAESNYVVGGNGKPVIMRVFDISHL